MCWFITVAVPRASRNLLEQMREEARSLHFQFLDSTPTTALFGPDYACVEVTRGGCSCSLMPFPPVDPAEELEIYQAKLRKKGLSDAKVRQALEVKAHALSKPKLDARNSQAFVEAVSALVTRAKSARLYSHFYRGNQHAEAVASLGTATISVHALQGNGLPPDTLVTVRAEV